MQRRNHAILSIVVILVVAIVALFSTNITTPSPTYEIRFDSEHEALFQRLLSHGDGLDMAIFHAAQNTQHLFHLYAQFHKYSLVWLHNNLRDTTKASSLSSPPTPRFIIYEVGMGGFANRWKSIASYLLLSMMTNRVFLYSWQHPFPISQSVQSSVPGLSLDLNTSPFKRVAHLITHRTSQWSLFTHENKISAVRKRNLATKDLSTSFPQANTVFVKGNEQFVETVFANAKYRRHLERLFADSDEYLHHALRFMMQPTEKVQRLMDQVTEETDAETTVVAAHLRTGDLEFDTGKNKFLDDEAKGAYLDCVVETVTKVQSSSSSPKVSVFLSADNETEIIRWRKEIDHRLSGPSTVPVLLTQGRPRHSFYDASGTELDRLKTAADFFLLCRGDILFRTERSSFGRLASLWCGYSKAKEDKAWSIPLNFPSWCSAQPQQKL